VTPYISVQENVFDVGDESERLTQQSSQTGALVCFTGLVRDINEGDSVKGMLLEHYPGMTEKSLLKIVQQAQTRWDLLGASVIHRVGKLLPSDPIVFVGVTSKHRIDAFESCQFIMDYLKTDAPFWKKEWTPQGEQWVEAKNTDEQAKKRW